MKVERKAQAKFQPKILKNVVPMLVAPKMVAKLSKPT